MSLSPFQRLISEIGELQRQPKITLPQKGNGLLKVVSLLPGDPDLLSLNLGLNLELGFLEVFDDVLDRCGFNALTKGDFLAHGLTLPLGLTDLEALEVDASFGEFRIQNIPHLLELKGAFGRQGDFKLLELESRSGPLEIKTGSDLPDGLIHGIGNLMKVQF